MYLFIYLIFLQPNSDKISLGVKHFSLKSLTSIFNIKIYLLKMEVCYIKFMSVDVSGIFLPLVFIPQRHSGP